MDWMKSVINFGEMSYKKIIAYLFDVGCAIIAYKAFIFGKYIYLSNFYNKDISFLQDGQTLYSSEKVNNLPLGCIAGIAYFLLIVVAWKLVCELLYIIFERIQRK